MGNPFQSKYVCNERLTAGITMFAYLKYEIKVLTPFVLPQDNWSFNSGKTNGVMPADVLRPFAQACDCRKQSHRNSGVYHGNHNRPALVRDEAHERKTGRGSLSPSRVFATDSVRLGERRKTRGSTETHHATTPPPVGLFSFCLFKGFTVNLLAFSIFHHQTSWHGVLPRPVMRQHFDKYFIWELRFDFIYIVR